MKIAVRYHSRSGNTKKVAQAIADAVGAEALPVSAALSEPVDILFLGSAVYAAGIDDAVKSFLAENSGRIGAIVNFSTAAVAESTFKQVQKQASAHGIAMSEREFHCRGAFAFLHRGRPNAEDLRAAADFAREAVKNF